MHPYHLSLFLSCALHARDPSKAPAPSSLKPRRYGKQRLPITQLARHVPAGPSGVAVSPPQTFVATKMWPLVVSVTSSAACAGRKMGKTPSRMVQNKLTRARTDECRTKANRLMIINVANRLKALVWWLHLLSAKKKGTVSEKQLSRKTQVANCFLQSWRSAPSVQESCCLHPSSSSPITFASCSLLNFRLSSLVVHKSWRRIPAPSCWKPHLSGGFWNCLPGPQKRGVSPSRSVSIGDLPLPNA